MSERSLRCLLRLQESRDIIELRKGLCVYPNRACCAVFMSLLVLFCSRLLVCHTLLR